MSTVVGVFSDRSSAESAVRSMRDQGIRAEEISIVAKDQRGQGQNEGGGDSIWGGTATGGAIGGAAGLLAGLGALAIPGMGPIVAAGPLAATLTGAVTGGLVGGLVDLGIPEERSRFYESRVREGDILAAVRSDDRSSIDMANRVMRDNGATNVEVH